MTNKLADKVESETGRIFYTNLDLKEEQTINPDDAINLYERVKDLSQILKGERLDDLVLGVKLEGESYIVEYRKLPLDLGSIKLKKEYILRKNGDRYPFVEKKQGGITTRYVSLTEKLNKIMETEMADVLVALSFNQTIDIPWSTFDGDESGNSSETFNFTYVKCYTYIKKV